MVPQNFQYEFENFVLLPQEGLLLQDGKVVPLTFRAIKVLILLVEKHGRVIQKDEFMETIWENSFVEEGNLPVAINAIRKVFGTEGRKAIETFPRRGYRFNGKVERVVIKETEQIPAKLQNNKLNDSNNIENISMKHISPQPSDSFYKLFLIVLVKFLQIFQPAYLKQTTHEAATT